MRNIKSNRMHGIKAGAYTESKMTNWTSFDPISSEIDKIYNKYYSELQKPSPFAKYFEEPLHKDFIRPVSIEEVKNEINRIPSVYSFGIMGVFLLGGSTKIIKTSDSLFSYVKPFSGYLGRYLHALKMDSAYALSLLTRGQL